MATTLSGAAANGFPGVAIAHSLARTRIYLGSPAIAVLPDGTYVAAHDTFGPGSKEDTEYVFASYDKGRDWKLISAVHGQYWSSLFTLRGELYLFGTSRAMGSPVIRRSVDGGRSWSAPVDGATGAFEPAGRYITAPVPVLIDHGRIWKTFEVNEAGDLKEQLFSAPVGSDLLDTSSWTRSVPLASSKEWLNGHFNSWEESSVVAVPGQSPKIVARVNTPTGPEVVAIVTVEQNGKQLEFDPSKDFVPMPGGGKKFSVRYDVKTKRYWTLANAVLDGPTARDLERVRNTLALISSPDLRNWTIQRVILHNPDEKTHGFQYADWVFDGDDLIAVVRVAFDDDEGGANDQHNANFITYVRVPSFRCGPPIAPCRVSTTLSRTAVRK